MTLHFLVGNPYAFTATVTAVAGAVAVVALVVGGGGAIVFL